MCVYKYEYIHIYAHPLPQNLPSVRLGKDQGVSNKVTISVYIYICVYIYIYIYVLRFRVWFGLAGFSSNGALPGALRWDVCGYGGNYGDLC